MKSLLSDILSTVSFKSAVYFKHGFCSPWGMDIARGDFSQFHLVTSGNCQLYMEESERPIKLEKGDIVIFPEGKPHQIKDQPGAICRGGKEVVQDIGKGIVPFEGAEISTHLICGHFEMDKDLSHPMFDKLPDCIIIKSSEYGRFDLIHSIFELIVEELRDQKAGYELVSIKLAEILYISIIRHYYLIQAKEALNLFRDELIFKAVDIIHSDLAANYNIELLARKVGISRTLFIERFKNAVGETPMKYISNWRMTKAKYFLKNTDLVIAQIGEKIGYQSETAFNRAFKKQFAISPGKFRKKEIA